MYQSAAETAAPGTYQWAGAESMLTRAVRRRGLRGLGDASAVGADAGTGATIGTVAGPWGAAIGGIVGAVFGIFSGNSTATGGAESASAKAAANALPQVPTAQSLAQQIAYKWYVLYFGRPSTDAGIAYWTTQISQDGAQRAWVNFSGSSQPIAAGVVAKAAQYAALGYGDQYSPIPAGVSVPGGAVASGTVLPALPTATAAGTAAAPLQASVLGSLTPTTILLGVALLIGGVMLTKRGSKSLSSEGE